MLSGSREKRGKGASACAGQTAREVTLVGTPGARRETRPRGRLYLERASLIAMTAKPVLVMSHPLPGEQTQIVRRPVRKAGGRRGIFIFGGAATATLLAAWLGLAQRAPAVHPVPVVAATRRAVVPAPSLNPAARPIVAPLAQGSPSPVAARGRGAPALPASGRHSSPAPARGASASRLAAHRAPGRPAHSTVAWGDPFVDR